MLNILGGAEPHDHIRLRDAAVEIPEAAVHMYGKGEGRPGRKMGHITVTANDETVAHKTMFPLIKLADHLRAERLQLQKTKQAIAKDPQPTTATPASSSAPTSQNLATPQPQPEPSGPPLVAITMGSDSDRAVLAPGAALLRDFGIPTITDITSAHRTPQRMFHFAETAASQGIKVIIAAAGGAAHLPGMIAAISRLPVIGVPVRASTLDGLDSLLSIVQMPVSVHFIFHLLGVD